MDTEDMLYLLYTSGSTGKPKGIVHTTGGYLTGVYATTRLVFDLKDTDVYWCTADVGWVTGHSYVVYGPLANGATTVMYEGTPDYPDKDRFWRIIEKHGITICYTAPTAIRTFMRWGDVPKGATLSRAARTVGSRQPGSLGLVLEGDRRRPLPGGGHLVADRDRAHPDHPAAGHHHAQARLGHAPLPRHRRRRGQRSG
jgi:non-ribosomal peptide synthetase component F